MSKYLFDNIWHVVVLLLTSVIFIVFKVTYGVRMEFPYLPFSSILLTINGSYIQGLRFVKVSVIWPTLVKIFRSLRKWGLFH